MVITALIRPAIAPLGDRAVMLSFSGSDEAATAAAVSGFCEALAQTPPEFITDIVPAFQRVCVHYDPVAMLQAGLNPNTWMTELAVLPYQPKQWKDVTTHEIPICYELGLDISVVAEQLAITEDVLMGEHAAASYRVAMIGFAPGFPYMTGLPSLLQLPRRSTPRTQVPAGSVAIAENLCGIYPKALPGGWHVIGRTPVTLFDPQRPVPCLLHAGDKIQFQPISRGQFEAWSC